jgi:hypothetical protein
LEPWLAHVTETGKIACAVADRARSCADLCGTRGVVARAVLRVAHTLHGTPLSCPPGEAFARRVTEMGVVTIAMAGTDHAGHRGAGELARSVCKTAVALAVRRPVVGENAVTTAPTGAHPGVHGASWTLRIAARAIPADVALAKACPLASVRAPPMTTANFGPSRAKLIATRAVAPWITTAECRTRRQRWVLFTSVLATVSAVANVQQRVAVTKSIRTHAMPVAYDAVVCRTRHGAIDASIVRGQAHAACFGEPVPIDAVMEALAPVAAVVRNAGAMAPAGRVTRALHCAHLPCVTVLAVAHSSPAKVVVRAVARFVADAPVESWARELAARPSV